MNEAPIFHDSSVTPSVAPSLERQSLILGVTALIMVGCQAYLHAGFVPLNSTALGLLALGCLCELTAIKVTRTGSYSLSMVFWSALYWLQPAAAPWIIGLAILSSTMRIAKLASMHPPTGAPHPPNDANSPQLSANNQPASANISPTNTHTPRTSSHTLSTGASYLLAKVLGTLNAILGPLTLTSLILQVAPAHWSERTILLLAGIVLTTSYALIHQFIYAIISPGTAPQMLLSWPVTILLLAQPALGILVAQLLNTSPILAIPVAIIFLALLASAPLLQLAQRARDTERLERHLHVTDYRLTVEREGHYASELRLTQANRLAQQRNLILDICHNCIDVATLQQMLFALCRSWWNATSTVLFRTDGEKIQPLAWQSPHERALASWDLLALREPLVERTLYTQHPTNLADVCNEIDETPTIFDEDHKYAFPWGKEGVLYLGCQQELSSTQLEQVAFLIREAAPCWQTLTTIASQDEQMHKMQTRNSALSAWAHHLEATLTALPKLSRLDTPTTLRAELLRLIPALVPAQQAAVITATDCPSILQPLWQAVEDNRCALLLGDIAPSRFRALHIASRSLLAVPLLDSGEMIALLIAESTAPQAFKRSDQDILTILACQAAVVWRNRTLHSSLQKAHRDLASSQSSLIQSSKLAAVGQLAAGVAHEVNTPLGAVMLGLDGALRSLSKDDGEKAVQRLQRAKEAASKAKDIVSKLLYYAREARQKSAAIDLNDIINDTLDFIGFHLDKAEISLTRNLGALPKCPGNANELQQVLTNLILNARDALRQISIPREIAIKSGINATDNRVWVTISDNGPGVTAELSKRIFEPFFTTKEPGQGTGLGLSISQEIMRRHKGTLTVESQPGCTSFTLSLPAGNG